MSKKEEIEKALREALLKILPDANIKFSSHEINNMEDLRDHLTQLRDDLKARVQSIENGDEESQIMPIGLNSIFNSSGLTFDNFEEKCLENGDEVHYAEFKIKDQVFEVKYAGNPDGSEHLIIGKKKSSKDKVGDTIKNLRLKLEIAIKSENYKEAINLRDEIKKLEENING